MVAIGDGLVQPVHDADRVLRTAGRGRNALKTQLLDIETFWQRLDQKLACQGVSQMKVCYSVSLSVYCVGFADTTGWQSLDPLDKGIYYILNRCMDFKFLA